MQVSQKHTGRSLQKLLSLQNTCLCLAPLAVLGQSHLSQALLAPTSEAWCDFHWRGSQELQQQLEQAIRKTPSKMKYMMEEINRGSFCPNMIVSNMLIFLLFSCSAYICYNNFKRCSKFLSHSLMISVDATSPFPHSQNLSSQAPKHLCNSR